MWGRREREREREKERGVGMCVRLSLSMVFFFVSHFDAAYKVCTLTLRAFFFVWRCYSWREMGVVVTISRDEWRLK